MGGLDQLATAFGSMMLRVGVLAAAIVTIWQFFKVIIAGKGAGTALVQACITLLIAGVALAALANPIETWSIFYLLGTTIYRAVFDAVQGALNAGQL